MPGARAQGFFDRPVEQLSKARLVELLIIALYEKVFSHGIFTFFPPLPVAASKVSPTYGSLTPLPVAVDSNCAGAAGAVIHPSGDFAYLSGGVGSPGKLCGFRIDPVTSALTSIAGTPVSIGSNPGAVAIEPSGKYLFAVGGTAHNVSVFAIDPATGTPAAVAGSPFDTGGTGPSSVVVDRAGRFVFVGNNLGSVPVPGSFAGSVAVFALNRATGALTHVPGSPFAMDRVFGDSANSLALTPDGHFLFVGGVGVTTFAVNATSGALAHVTEIAGVYPAGLAVEPTGRFLYVPDSNQYVVRGYAIGTTGHLTPVGTPPTFGAPTGLSSRGITILNDLLYVANTYTDSIYGFRINGGTGALAPVAGSPFSAVGRPYAPAGHAPLNPSVRIDAGDYFIGTYGVLGGQPPYNWTVEAGALPPGLSLDATGVVWGTVGGSGPYTFSAKVVDGLGASDTQTKTLAVSGGVSGSPAVPVVEFYNHGLDHYFITWVTDEIAKLDAGTTIKGWTRTGKTFPVYTAAQTNTSPVCRYYIPPGLGDSHFFGRGTTECVATGQKNPSFLLEDPSFMHVFLPVAGVCPANTLQVYRVFSNRPDANHRYMTDKAVRDQMVALGWLAEGDGPDLVVMCAPAS